MFCESLLVYSISPVLIPHPVIILPMACEVSEKQSQSGALMS